MEPNDSNLPKIPPSGGQPLVSLVVPVFNAGKYLTECLESIASQTVTDYEVIVVDDGSTDDSIDIATHFCESDPRFILLKSPHGGVSKARNTGIDISRGKYLGFVDADDCLHPEALESLLRVLDTTGAQVCIGKFERATRFRPKKCPPASPLVMDYTTAMKKALYQSLILNSPWGMLMERELLGSDVRFREGIRYEDLDAFYRFYENATTIAYLPVVIYFYRQESGSFMHQWSHSRIDALDVTDNMVKYMSEYHPKLTKASLDRRFSAHFNMLLLILKNNIDDSHTIERCLGIIKAERANELYDPNVRLKNKLGAFLSYGGLPLIKFLSRF